MAKIKNENFRRGCKIKTKIRIHPLLIFPVCLQHRQAFHSKSEGVFCEERIKIRNRVADELKGRVTNLEDIRLEAFRQTLKDIGSPNDVLASHLNQVYLKHRFEDIELFDDVLPALEALQAKYNLGILSNGNSYPERCGLESIFQFVVFSQDYGVEKPNPKLFEIAVEKAGCSKQQLLHVGDSLQNDVMGAINAGIKCVWVNRNDAKNNLHLKIDYEVSSLLELLEIL